MDLTAEQIAYIRELRTRGYSLEHLASLYSYVKTPDEIRAICEGEPIIHNRVDYGEREEWDAAQAELAALRAELAACIKIKDAFHEQRDSMKAERDQARAQCKEMEGRLADAERELANAKADLDPVKRQRDHLWDDNAAVVKDRDEARAALARMREALECWGFTFWPEEAFWSCNECGETDKKHVAGCKIGEALSSPAALPDAATGEGDAV